MTTVGHTPMLADAIGDRVQLRRLVVLERTLLAALLLSAAALRFTGLERESRHGDEYRQTMVYSMPPQYVALSSRAVGQPPLDSLIGWAVTRISPTVWAMRAPAAMFGVVGVAITFLLVRRMTFSFVAALVAAGIVAFSPLHWKMSQTARPYTIFVAAFLLTMWALWRALDQPDRRRLVVYGLSAWIMTHTRSFGPLVCVLCIALTLAAAYGVVWIRGNRFSHAGRALLRVGLVTAAVALAAIPILLFVMSGAGEWTALETSSTEEISTRLAEAFSRWVCNAGDWWLAREAWFGPAAVCVLAVAIWGAFGWLRRWHMHSLGVRVVSAVMLLCGPAYLAIYTVVVHDWSIRDRYGLFMVPVVALFAGIGVEAVSRWMRTRYSGSVASSCAVVALVLAVWISPALGTATWKQRFGNPDWRGCAAYLSDKVNPDDVVILLADRKLGATQPPFWGKVDWPKARRPLAESAWTLATSQSHWNRLLQQQGRCFVVLMHMENRSPRDAYLKQGLQTAPAGWTLKKFRRLDLLYRAGEPETGTSEHILDACDLLASVPLEHEEARAIPLVLRSRLLREQGDPVDSLAAFEQARAHVPPQSLAWFEAATKRFAPLAPDG